MANRGDPVGAYYRNFTNAFKPNATVARLEAIKQMHMRSFIEIACNRFKWEGLPPTVSIRHLELTLFTNALAVFSKLPDNDQYQVLQASPSGVINMVQEPTSFTLVGSNMKTREISAKQCVPIWANYLRVPDIDIVEIYSQRLADLERTIEINTMNARRTKVIVHDENATMSMTNVDRQLNEGASTIRVNSDNVADSFTALDMGIDTKSLIDLSMMRARYMNDVFSLLGINGANQDKKERLVASEVGANDDQVLSRKFVALNARRIAAEQISEMIDEEVTVEFNVEVEAQAKEEIDNGDIHTEA